MSLSACNAHIGPVGAMFPVRAAVISAQTGRPVSFTDTLGGRKAFVGRWGRREWSVELTTTNPAEISHVEWWSNHQVAPVAFHPPGAGSTNLLNPSSAGLAPGRHSGVEGPMVSLDGITLNSAVPSGSGISLSFRMNGRLDPTPLVPGAPVTVSAWLRGGSTAINTIWRDGNGESTTQQRVETGPSQTMVRRHVTHWPPPGTVQATFQLFGAQIAGPAVTHTRDIRPWAPGTGAHRVVVSDFSSTTLHIPTEGPHQGVPIKTYAFKATEVG